MDHSPSASVGRPEIVQKVTRRLIPFVGICYLIAYIDRQNVSFAKLQMAGDLGLSEYAYGLGASLFFIGYFLFEVPSNVILEKVGARRWFARIMISWGLGDYRPCLYAKHRNVLHTAIPPWRLRGGFL